MNEDYLKRNHEIISKYDEIVFPNLEKTPKKYAILKRNFWMVEKANLVIAYVKYPWGGAAKTLEYAKKKGKKIVNLFDL